MFISERRHFVEFCTIMMLNSGVWQILPPERERVKENEAALKCGKCEFRLCMQAAGWLMDLIKEQVLD